MGRANRPPRGFALNLIGGMLACCSSAQSLYMPPANLINSLSAEALPRSIEINTLYLADTNVRPLLRHASGTEFPGARSYLTGASLYEVRLRWERWEVRYAYGQADLFEGDSGAARLFLESEQERLRPDTTYPVSATLNRSATHRWTLAYHGTVHMPNTRLRYCVGLSYVHLQRVQLGWLQGQKTGDSFTGRLTLLTTRGVPAPQIGGEGYLLSVGASLEHADWTISLFVDNLWSYLRVRTLQQIDATVRVNQLVPDADGFLRAPPFLEGRVLETSLRPTAHPRTELALWRRVGTHRYGLIALQGEPQRIALAWAQPTPAGTLWIAHWHPHPMVWLGYETRYWHLILGTDSPQRHALRRVYGALRVRIPIR